MNTFQFIIRLLCAAVLLCTMTAPRADDAAVAVIKQTATQMLSTLEQRRSEVQRDSRLIYQLVSSIVLPHFDFKTITQAAIGREWKTATPSQQQALMNGFQQMLVRTYARALLNYTSHDILYQTPKPGTRPNTIIVPTMVQAAGAPALPIDYRLQRQGDEWKVYDVIIENVSLVATYRGQFRTIISSSGVDGLIQELTNKNATKN